jgi:hypothetical protein
MTRHLLSCAAVLALAPGYPAPALAAVTCGQDYVGRLVCVDDYGARPLIQPIQGPQLQRHTPIPAVPVQPMPTCRTTTDYYGNFTTRCY